MQGCFQLKYGNWKKKEGNSCFADEFYVFSLKEREAFQGSQVKPLGDYAIFFQEEMFIPCLEVLGTRIVLCRSSGVQCKQSAGVWLWSPSQTKAQNGQRGRSRAFPAVLLLLPGLEVGAASRVPRAAAGAGWAVRAGGAGRGREQPCATVSAGVQLFPSANFHFELAKG